jgi:hypothetical protein
MTIEQWIQLVANGLAIVVAAAAAILQLIPKGKPGGWLEICRSIIEFLALRSKNPP